MNPATTTQPDILDKLLARLDAIEERLDLLTETQGEILEKVNNLNFEDEPLCSSCGGDLAD